MGNNNPNKIPAIVRVLDYLGKVESENGKTKNNQYDKELYKILKGEKGYGNKTDKKGDGVDLESI